MRARTRLPRGQGDALREEVLEAAEALLLEYGNDEAVSIRAVADAVGVTPPSIYRHFAGKEELILATCDRQFARFNDELRHAVAGASTPLDELRAQGEAYIEFGLDHPEAYVVMFMRPPSAVLTDMERPQAYAALVDAVQRAIEAGQLADHDADVIAQVIWSSVHGITSLLIAKPDFPWAKRRPLIDAVLTSAVAPFLPTFPSQDRAPAQRRKR